MQEKRIYISVILPLRLEWEPCYWTDMDDIRTGQRVKVRFAGRIYSGVVSGTGIPPQTSPSRILQITGPDSGKDDIRPEEIAFWRQLASYYMCSVGEVYKTAYPNSRTDMEDTLARKAERLKSRIEKKIGQIAGARTERTRKRYEEELESLRSELDCRPQTLMKTDIGLSDEQHEAKERVLEAFKEGKTVLLNGVAGSGKTEIYTSLAYDTLENGKSVLYLVPEIAMGRQLEDRLRDCFGSWLLTYHSGLKSVRNAETVARLRRQDTYILFGTRSALFLPHHNLGLIIVDEEHDSSYKQDSPAPRYNGRDAAIMLGRIQAATGNGDGCGIILGSATPSLESIYNCLSGKYSEVALEHRFFGTGETETVIIDTIAERKKKGMTGSFSRKLTDRIEGALAGGGQVMLLRARRGYSPVLQCADCGFIPKCPKCNVSLTYHKDCGRIICHHCGYAVQRPESCPECGGEMKELGAGTQKIEEEAAALFPGARIDRLDSDSSRNGRSADEIIRRFSSGETDILIGTQILAKGFDFSRLSLVAVLQADTLLGMQDFRADEKALQTLEQFRGRCGRRGGKGVFVIQTAQPEHPVYRALSTYDGQEGSETLKAFERELLAERAEFGYPPYTRIIDITGRDISETRVEKMSRELAAVLSGYNVTGPYTPVTAKSDGEYVRKLRITLAKDRQLTENKERLLEIIRKYESSSRYTGHFTIDVDPS